MLFAMCGYAYHVDADHALAPASPFIRNAGWLEGSSCYPHRNSTLQHLALRMAQQAEPELEPSATDDSSAEEADDEGVGSESPSVIEWDPEQEGPEPSEQPTEIIHTFITEAEQDNFTHPLPIVRGPFNRGDEEIANLNLADRFFYVVWVIPGRQDLQGIHYGNNAWPGLEERFQGRRNSRRDGVYLQAEVVGERTPRMLWNEAEATFFGEVDRHNTREGWPLVQWCWLFRWP